MSALNVGQGRCQGTARLLVRPVRAVIELGASKDVVQAVCGAVHHCNRHGSVDDFLALAFPMMASVRGFVQAGHEIEILGSDASLASLLATEGMARLVRRGMVEPLEVDQPIVGEGDMGVAYVRDQRADKGGPGWLRRRAARSARNGKPLGVPAMKKEVPDLSELLQLVYGEKSLMVGQVCGVVTGEPLLVSTYGFSARTRPAFLPVLPAASVDASNAA